MNIATSEQLINDTLYLRRLQPNNSCLVTNEAGQELIQQPASILPQLEATIRDTLAPAFASSDTGRLLGSSDILGAYLIIGARNDASKVVAFLQLLPVELQAEAVGLLPVFFKRLDGRYKYDTPIPSEFLDFASRHVNHKLTLFARRRSEQ